MFFAGFICVKGMHVYVQVNMVKGMYVFCQAFCDKRTHVYFMVLDYKDSMYFSIYSVEKECMFRKFLYLFNFFRAFVLGLQNRAHNENVIQYCSI